MLWDSTRYIGCSYEICSSITDKKGVIQTDAALIVCHFYMGANLTDVSAPYADGTIGDECSLKDRSQTGNDDLCYGCPQPDYELCVCLYSSFLFCAQFHS